MVIRRFALLVLPIASIIALTGCGGPSDSEIQATVQAAVQGTAQAEQIAESVKATQEAETACGEEALSAYADEMNGQITAFAQQAQLVGATPRVGLGVPLQRLLAIQTETRKLKTPACLKDYQERVAGMMQLHQMGYQNFAAQGDETTTQATLQVAADELSAVQKGITDLRAGTLPAPPVATPTPKG